MLDATVAPRVAHQQHDSADSLASPRMPCGRIWVVVHTHPQAERWARDNLASAGYPVYLPMLAVQRRDAAIRSLLHTVLVPMFNRYLFCELGADDPWTPIRYTPGVFQLLMTDGKPGHVDAGVLSELRAGEETRRTLTTRKTLHRPGAACGVAYGVLAGHRAVVLRVTSTQAVVALMLLGALREVTLPLDSLAPAT